MAGTKDIKDFTKFPSLSDNDYLLGTKTDLGGTDAGITVGNFKKQVANDAAPSINENGYWVVNGVSTGEKARGETPVLNSGTTTTGEEGTGASSEVVPDGQTPEGSPKYKLNLTLPRGSAGKVGKTAIFGIGNVSDGEKASATLTADGEDGSGNPKYKLNLVLPAGKTGENGKTPKFEAGSVSTLEPGQLASAEISFKEYDTDGSPIYVISLSIPKGDTGSPGKTPVLKSVNAKSGDTPSGSFIADGTDESGNPKYILNLTLPAGKDGQPAIFEQGTTTTLEPTEPASVEVVENGTTPEGNPKYILNFSIPRGQVGKPGIGSGNVSADGTGLVAGKKYLFVPESDGSTSGAFVEYVAPEAYDDTPLRKEIADNLAAAKTYTNEQIAGIVQFDIKAVPELPDTGVKGTIYLVPKTGSGNDVHNEYIWDETSSKFELIGSTSVDLSDYYTKNEANERYVLKEAGKRLMTNAEGAKLEGIESGANKFQYPVNPGEGQVLTWSAGAAKWDNPASGYEYIELGDILQISRVKTSTELDWNDFIKGKTMDDLEQAYINNTPIYSKIQSRYFGEKMGYSQCTSIMKIVDGTVVHYYLSFVVAYSATNSDNIYNYLIDLRGVTGEGWRDATSRASCLFTKTAVPVGTSIPFTGGFVIMDLSTGGSRDLIINPPGFYPLQNSTTTIMLRNTSSLTTKLTFTIKLSSDASSEGSKLLIPSELPELAGGEACELSILWADWKYIVRASEPFNYKEYVE